MTTSQGSKGPLPKWQIFEHSYNEVLAALKHQDEKLNRTLTALAFLSAAGVALFLQLETARPRLEPVEFPEGGPSVTAVLFVTFLIAVAIALVTALAAIGPGRALRLRPREEREPSLLYYGSIANVSEAQWKKRLDHDGEDALTEALTANFHSEARKISHRVVYKVSRSRESGAFVQLAIVALGLLGIFEARGVSLITRWWLATGLIVLLLALLCWEAFRMNHDKYANVQFNCAYAALLAAALMATFFLAIAEAADEHWPALGYAVSVLVLSRLAAVGPTVATYTLGAALVLVLVPILTFTDVL
jgi:hypothetical protein